MKIFKAFAVAIAIAMALPVLADAPDGYYSKAEGKTGQALLTALYDIINSHTKISYDGLWDAYKTTDVTLDGKYYWDMYATTQFPLGQKHCGSYSSVGDCVNREHSFPKSWWGGGKADQYSDIFHLYPTDGYVNNQRSAYPFGECADGVYLPANGSNKPLGKLGISTFSGYSGKVFEPDDIYKGDFARTYFYMATCYNDKIGGWSSPMLAGNSYPVYTTWAVNLLMKWHRQDAVSDKETNRNNAAYTKQKNRNPFIDHPELAEYIWGNKVGTAWYPGASTDPVLSSPSNGTTVDFGNVAVNKTATQTVTVQGRNLTQALTVSVRGNAFSTATSTISAAAANSGTTLTISYTAPATAQASTGTLVITSDEVNATVQLKAQSIDGIPALSAQEITTTSFRARWTDMGDATNYLLHVYSDDGTTELRGYPVSVTASAGSYLVTGLEANTTYYYQLTSTGLKSNIVEVTTLDHPKIISIQSDSEAMLMTANLNEASTILEAQVYTEYVTEEVELTVTGNFEISLDKRTWATALKIDPEGETFYVRIADTSAEGNFDGELTAATATLDGYSTDIMGVVTDPDADAKQVTEGFESCTTGGYWTKQVQGDVFLWDFTDAGIWADQHRDGVVSCRFGKTGSSSIAMAEDYTHGASGFSFMAAPYGSDADATLVVSYSTDGGSHWTDLQAFSVTTAQGAPALSPLKATTIAGLTEYTVTQKFNIAGNIRFKISQTSGSRVNVDNITITAYKSPATIINVIDNTDEAPAFDAVPSRGGITIESATKAKLHIYNVEAQEVAKVTVAGSTTVALPDGIYIVTDGKHARKVVVR